MAEEVKEEEVKEETSSDESTESLESAGEVTTSPTVEGEENIPSYVVQLEQRISSIEQRLNGQEQQQEQQQQQEPPQEEPQADEPSGDEQSSDDEESTEDVKKILGL